MLELVPCCWMSLLQGLLLFVVFLLVMVVFLVKYTTLPHPTILDFPQERTYLEGSEQGAKLGEFPSIDDAPSIDLSVIVPAYNEEQRLPCMLEECLQFLKDRKDLSFEVILVDDGSKDNTSKVGLSYVDKYGSDSVRVLTLAKNRGKGGAVRMGMLKARGKNLLFADADGATTFEDLVKLEECMKNIEKDGHGVVCGSRAHMEKDSIANRTLIRTILMFGFHACVYVFAVKSVRDTQCGFKLLKRKTAQIVFKSLHIERWAFDVELLKMAEMLELPIGEMAVRWQEIDGSKLNSLLDAIKMFETSSFYGCGMPWELGNAQSNQNRSLFVNTFLFLLSPTKVLGL